MGCAPTSKIKNDRVSSSSIYNQRSSKSFSVAKLSQTRLDLARLNRKMSVRVEPPVCPILSPVDQIKLHESWLHFQSSSEPNSAVNAFSHMLIQHPEMYWQFFRWRPPPGATTDAMDSTPPFENDKLIRHNKAVHTALECCINFALHNELTTAEHTLQRLGALHAEIFVTGNDMLLFETSLMLALDNMDKAMMDSQCRQIWISIVNYMTRNIIIGLNSYNDRLVYTLDPEEFQRELCCGRCRKAKPLPVSEILSLEKWGYPVAARSLLSHVKHL